MNIQVRTRGRITLPKVWREANRIEAGDLITLTGLENGVILLRAQPSRAGRLINKLANELRKAGITLPDLPDLLDELRQLRK